MKKMERSLWYLTSDPLQHLLPVCTLADRGMKVFDLHDYRAASRHSYGQECRQHQKCYMKADEDSLIIREGNTCICTLTAYGRSVAVEAGDVPVLQ